jgi:hypothetical protein
VARDRLRLGGARLAQVLNSLHAAYEAQAAADAAAVGGAAEASPVAIV